jgi:hypothetical protein
MTSIFKGSVQLAYHPSATWTASNPVLLAGQLGFESDTRNSKIGDGLTAWNLLPYTNNGGATQFASLTDRATADLPNINTLLAAALALKSPFEVPVAYSTLIPLDTKGNGKLMPPTTLSANSVFGVGANPVDQGNCNFALIGDGTHSPDFSAFNIADGYTYSPTLNANNCYTAVYTSGTPFLWGVLGNPVVTSSGYLLLEDGTHLLLEDGTSKFLL